jgi:putative zinc finger/helix-turn-helix YgiT family protein
MKCPECGGKVTQRVGDYPYLGEELPNVVLVGVKLRTCTECEFSSVGIPKLVGLHKAIAECLAKATHQLSPGEIRFLRKYLGWSGRDFARHFGVSAETVSRWENGKNTMGATAERLLRLSALTLDPIQEYPLPDNFSMRSDKPGVRATLHGSWKLEVA